MLNTGDTCLHLNVAVFCVRLDIFTAHKWASNKKASELRLHDLIIHKISLVNFFKMAKFAG